MARKTGTVERVAQLMVENPDITREQAINTLTDVSPKTIKNSWPKALAKAAELAELKEQSVIPPQTEKASDDEEIPAEKVSKITVIEKEPEPETDPTENSTESKRGRPHTDRTEKLTVTLSPEDNRKLRVYVAASGTTISKWLHEAITALEIPHF